MPSVPSQVSLTSLVSTDSGREKEVPKDSFQDETDAFRRKKTKTSDISMSISCPTCSEQDLDNNWCSRCSGFSLRCGICQEGIRGAAVYCPVCLHGGHIDHMRQWFEDMEQPFCPTGCGCDCSAMLKSSEQIIDTTESDSDDSYSDQSGHGRLLQSSYSESSAAESDNSSSSSGDEIMANHKSAHQRLFQKI